jgi:hypothetical protein
MGIDRNGLKFLLNAKETGVDFNSFVTIGRQGLYMSPLEFTGILKSYNYTPSPDFVKALFDTGYADSFYKEILGAGPSDSIDSSSYEAATIVHDLNYPIPERLKNTYTALFDGGSLEHIFNFPVAFRNAVDMLKINGCFLGVSPTNNFCGHGFYQFSPELWFRLFTAENGFELEYLLMYTDSSETNWFRVKDPSVLKKRMALINAVPTYLAIRARKIASVELFLNGFPQQSDYSAAWKDFDRPDGQTDEPSAVNRNANKNERSGIIKRIVRMIFKEEEIQRPGDISPDFVESFPIGPKLKSVN